MKRTILSLFSALVLTVGLLCITAAAAGPRLVTAQAAAPSQSVTLTGLSADCQSLQVTLSLSGSGSTYIYAPDAGLNRNGIYATSKQSGSQVTLYITARNGVLASDGALSLGTLTAADGASFTVTGFSGLQMVDPAAGEIPVPEVDNTGSESENSNSSTGDDSGSTGNHTGTGTGGSTDNTKPQPLPFTDVADGTWYAEAVRHVYQLGLITGTSDTSFSPDMTTSRAMLVTLLYRLEGSPAVSGPAAFPDVTTGQWYADAVVWANDNGIVTGYDNGRFGPGDTITREQMAAIFYRYAVYKGYDTTTQSHLSGYSDAGQVSPYAMEAMGWAVDTGLITGTSDTTLSPAGSATRAQAATILTRFCQAFADI